jgi:hypothetical protein
MAPGELDRWWERYRDGLADDADPAEIAQAVRSRLATVRGRVYGRLLRRALRDLTRRGAYGAVLHLLQTIRNPDYLHDVASGFDGPAPAPDDDEEAWLADLMRVLAAADEENWIAPLRRYLLEWPMDAHWTTVPWALWPHRAGLFAAAWARYFREREPGDWRAEGVLRTFLGDPLAIRAVAETLDGEEPARWAELRRQLSRRAGDVTWLSTDQRAELERALR